MAIGGVTSAFATDIPPDAVFDLHEPVAEHINQADLNALVLSGNPEAAFQAAFEGGDELFEGVFNALDGSGANVGDGLRFTRIPRADLDGPGQWLEHFPARETGPNAQACNQCHLGPFDDGAGTAASLVHRDPTRMADLGSLITRDTPHLFGSGALQRLAEEMTEELHLTRDALEAQVCATGQRHRFRLFAKGLSFGTLVGRPSSSSRDYDNSCQVNFRFHRVTGVDDDLVVRPFQWKGSVTFLRDFNRGASHNEIGMQAVELVGENVDGDYDGVVNEMTVGDQTGLSIYIAAQPRPTTKLELDDLGLLDQPLTAIERNRIQTGGAVFEQIGCASCHQPELTIDLPVFSEPSQHAEYRDAVFPAGQDPVSLGLDSAIPVAFDLTRDQPDNLITDASGAVVARLGAFEADISGRAIVRLYGDLRTHYMGPELAEAIDEEGTGEAVWMTKELWGVGSTAPYLHDGRATTLTEAILAHGGEANSSKSTFEIMPLVYQESVIAFLENLVLFKIEEE